MTDSTRLSILNVGITAYIAQCQPDIALIVEYFVYTQAKSMSDISCYIYYFNEPNPPLLVPRWRWCGAYMLDLQFINMQSSAKRAQGILL